MTAADQIRALADTGTPGPLTEVCLGSEGYVVVEATPTAIGRRRRQAASCRYEDWDTCKADAAKIVAAVNTLPHIANLIDATERHQYQSSQNQLWCDICGDLDVAPCDAVTAARDALVEALLGVPES